MIKQLFPKCGAAPKQSHGWNFDLIGAARRKSRYPQKVGTILVVETTTLRKARAIATQGQFDFFCTGCFLPLRACCGVGRSAPSSLRKCSGFFASKSDVGHFLFPAARAAKNGTEGETRTLKP